MVNSEQVRRGVLAEPEPWLLGKSQTEAARAGP